MAWSKKKTDPISERAQTLTAEIAALESQIKKLDAQLHSNQAHPRLRSTAVPHGSTITHTTQIVEPAEPPLPVTREPVFEEVDQEPLTARPEPPAHTPEHYNELGVRKYDLTALGRKIRSLFSGPSTSNPRLVTYLAAGGVQGLRPLRYEKRVARNRFLTFAIGLFLLLLGILWWFVRHR
jgi:hypothetical protein